MNLTEFLTTPAAPELISWKMQTISKNDPSQGSMVSYLDGQYYENRLDEGVTQGVLESWSEVTDIVGEIGGEMVARCQLTLTTPDGKSVQRTGIGATPVKGGSTASLSKSAATDAFKRACARAGLGQFLYDLPQPVVPVEGKFQTRESKAQMPAYTKRLMEAYLSGMSSEDLERNFKWALRDGGKGQQRPAQQRQPQSSAPAPEMAKAVEFVKQAEAAGRAAGKAKEVDEILKQHANWTRSVDQARSAYRQLGALTAN